MFYVLTTRASHLKRRKTLVFPALPDFDTEYGWLPFMRATFVDLNFNPKSKGKKNKLILTHKWRMESEERWHNLSLLRYKNNLFYIRTNCTNKLHHSDYILSMKVHQIKKIIIWWEILEIWTLLPVFFHL